MARQGWKNCPGMLTFVQLSPRMNLMQDIRVSNAYLQGGGMSSHNCKYPPLSLRVKFLMRLYLVYQPWVQHVGLLILVLVGLTKLVRDSMNTGIFVIAVGELLYHQIRPWRRYQARFGGPLCTMSIVRDS